MSNPIAETNSIPVGLIKVIKLASNISLSNTSDVIMIRTTQGDWFTTKPFTVNSQYIVGDFVKINS